MARPAINLLLVAVLLLCPLGCFLRQTLGSVVAPAAAAACCSHCRQEGSPDAPLPSQDDGGGRCCLCEGALHDGPSRSVEVDLHADDLAGFLILPAETVAFSGHALPSAEQLFGPPDEASGRALRTRLASLLL
jgi:hypothetical protein